MNNFWKRFSCLILIVPLFLSFFVIPADAAETQASCFDLLAVADSFMDLNSGEFESTPILSASRSTGVTSRHGLRISTNAPLLFESIYITLHSDVIPQYLYCNDIRGNLTGSSDTWSMWVFDMSGSDPRAFFDLKATMPSNFSGWADFAVGAFYGFFDSELVVDYAHFYIDSSGTSTHLPSSEYGVDLPTDFTFWADYNDSLPATFLVKMELESPVSFCDYMEVSISVPFVKTTGTVSLDRAFLSSFLEASFFISEVGLEEDYRPLEVIYSDIGACDVQYGGTFASFIYTFRVDTSGYDLGNYVVGCNFFLRAYTSEEFSSGGDWVTEYLSRLRVWPAYFGLPVSYPNFFAGFVGRFELYAFNINTWFEETFNLIDVRLTEIWEAITGKDAGASAEAGDIQDGFDQLENFADSLESAANDANSDIVTNVGAGITSFGPALAFVGHWLSGIADAIGPFHIVLTWPIFIGICMFIYHRVPGVTRIRRSGKNDGGTSDAG